MREIFQPLLFLLARSSEAELRRKNEFLKAENELLRKRVPKKRIFLKPDERDRLLKRGRGTWSEFLRIHAETLWQCNFFSKRTWPLQGPRQVFALAFINNATRRVFLSPSTLSTNGRWMEQQAEAFTDHARRERLPCTIVIRDHDNAFSQAYDQVFKDNEIRVKPVGPQAPNLNAFVERWIRSLQQEALDHFFVFWTTALRYARMDLTIDPPPPPFTPKVAGPLHFNEG
jgi:hypothetical protein